jgi:cytochrome bd-type quinol oxidase subunit 2
MLKILNKKIVTLFAALTLLVVPLACATPAFAAVDLGKNLGCGSNLGTSTGGDCGTSTGSGKITSTITTLVNIFSVLVGIVSVIMIIVGGFQYITSSGDSNKVTTAKNTIVYAIIGLVIVALAQFIVQFVLHKLIGTA